jgi:phospholipid:diacylglycerol acyltransferase
VSAFLTDRAIAPDVLDFDLLGLQTLRHVMRMTRTWDATMSMIPKGGDTIWGGLDWAPEDGYECSKVQKKQQNGHNGSQKGNGNKTKAGVERPRVNYGRIVSFGKDVAEVPSSIIERLDFRVCS